MAGALMMAKADSWLFDDGARSKLINNGVFAQHNILRLFHEIIADDGRHIRKTPSLAQHGAARLHRCT